MSVVRLEQVSVVKPQNNISKKILDSVSFTAEDSQIYVIVGPSGSGKSTLLRLINRLTDPTEGHIYYREQDIRKVPVTDLRRKIGMVFQQPVLFSGTVEENIYYGPRLKGEKGNQAEDYLKMVGLGNKFGPRDVKTLSGGQQQRVAVARALINKPDVLLLDEPTSALDPTATEQLESLMVGLVKSFGLTLVWVTHNIEQAKRVGDRTMLLVNGQIVEDRPTTEFFAHPEHELAKQFLAGKLEAGGAGQ